MKMQKQFLNAIEEMTETQRREKIKKRTEQQETVWLTIFDRSDSTSSRKSVICLWWFSGFASFVQLCFTL